MIAIAIPRSISGHTSDIGQYIETENEKAYNALQSSDSLGLKAKGVFQQLEDAFHECSIPGWDGGNASPISPEVLRYAWIFLDSLPLGISSPGISAEPDGMITFEWYCNPRRVLSVSIDSDGRLYYAALIGTSKRHGADYIQTDISTDISEDLINLINQIVQE